MLNIEKYAEEIKKEIVKKHISITCAAHNIRNNVENCSDDKCGIMCSECEVTVFDWLISEIKKECHTCKHHGKIEGKENVFACLHEGQVIEQTDDEPCRFWEV